MVRINTICAQSLFRELSAFVVNFIFITFPLEIQLSII